MQNPQLLDEEEEYYKNKTRDLLVHQVIKIVQENSVYDADDLFVVWFSKTLDHWKALVATTFHGDGTYFEVTHNGHLDETYIDIYEKMANFVVQQKKGTEND